MICWKVIKFSTMSSIRLEFAFSLISLQFVLTKTTIISFSVLKNWSKRKFKKVPSQKLSFKELKNYLKVILLQMTTIFAFLHYSKNLFVLFNEFTLEWSILFSDDVTQYKIDWFRWRHSCFHTFLRLNLIYRNASRSYDCNEQSKIFGWFLPLKW